MNYYTSNHGATMNSESYYPVNSGKPLNETAGLFSAFFKEKRKELCEKMSRKISTKEIGLMLDMDYESFRKSINKQKQTKKRDCIIAICTVLGCDGTAANEALSLYGFPELDEYHRRDEIWDALIKNSDSPLSVEELNDLLTAESFAPLDNYTHRSTEKKVFPYKLVRRQFQCTLEGIGQVNDPDCFLDLRYDTECFYNMRTCMEYLGGGRLFEVCIQYEGSHLYDVCSVGFDYSHIEIERLPKEYQIQNDSVLDKNRMPELQRLAPEADCKYHELFEELDAAEEKERRRIWSMLLDSRNTGKRISAKIIDNQLHIFTETYNYDMPELGEYYLMDYCDGVYSFSVSDVSRFMTLYLSREKYLQYYGEYSELNTQQYTSLEEIAAHEKDYAEKGYSEHKLITRHRMNAFQRMQNEIDDLRRKLKRGKAQIRSRDLFGFGEYIGRKCVCVSFRNMKTGTARR